MTQYVDPFVLTADEYKRKIDPVGQYITSAAHYLQTTTGQPLDVCEAYVRKNIKPDGKFALNNREVTYFERDQYQNRQRKTIPVLGYLKETIENNHLLAPTWTTYMHPDQRESILAMEINVRKKRRGVAKKKGAACKANKDMQGYTFFNGQQTQMKRSNNALSGAAQTPSTPIYNKTSHPTLTTVCRITSGLGNACNEKLLSGNRHYYSVHVVLNDACAIVTHTNYPELEAMIKRWGLVIPSVEQTFECAMYSARLYWRSDKHEQILKNYFSALNDLQRAAYVYTGDLYQVLKLNDAFMREFMDQLTTKGYEVIDEPERYLHSASELMINVVHQICTEEAKGIGKNYAKLRNPDHINILAGTGKHLERVFMHYADFISVVMRSDNCPSSLAVFPSSVRRAAITSDTDSTIFTVQDWIVWYMGKVDFSPKGISVQAVLTYITSMAIVHVLARMSANLGVAKRHIFEISMKPEFRFDVFVPTRLAKTYYASIGCKEGNVYEENELEIKGVMLKNSANPPDVNAAVEAMIGDICNTVIHGEKISLMAMLKRVADMETQIINSIMRGETKYLKGGTIKDAESYTKDEDESPYSTYTFWMNTFATKYGPIQPPPYAASKVSLDLGNTRKIKAWLETIEDETLRTSLANHFASTGKTSLTTLHIPKDYLEQKGLPQDLFNIIDRRKIAGELCKAFYLVLETLGDYRYQDDVRRLVCETVQF
jgi:hypothetical protein